MDRFVLLLALVIMAMLAACSDPTPAPETVETSTPEAVPVTSAPPANTTRPEAPRATAAPTPSIPTTSTPIPPGVPPALPAQDQEALISSLSEDELSCIDQNPERMIATLIGGPEDPPASVEEMAKLIGCLDDDTVNQFFIAAIVPGPGPLTAETTDCVLAGLHVIDPRAMMTAGLVEDEPERVFFGSMAVFNVSIACLTDKEWERAALASGISDQGRAGLQCLMAELGGPDEYAEALLKTQEGNITELVQAGAECRVGISVPWQPPATPTPMPTATTVAPPPTPTAPISAPTPAPGADESGTNAGLHAHDHSSDHRG